MFRNVNTDARKQTSKEMSPLKIKYNKILKLSLESLCNICKREELKYCMNFFSLNQVQLSLFQGYLSRFLFVFLLFRV